MTSLNTKCKHPIDWVLKLQYGGKRYTYCVGCLVEKAGLRNLEAYDNPFVKHKEVVSESIDVVDKKSKTK